MTNLKIAIIGANGFIARHLVRALANNPQCTLQLFGRNAPDVLPQGTTYTPIDLLDSEALKKQLGDADLVYYMVSETNPAVSWNHPQLELEKNLRPFINFMECICHTRVKKVAFISSAGTVYGSTTGKVAEDYDKQPFSPYGIMKLTIENFLRFYKARNNIAYDIYRVSNVYGEGQDITRGVGIINTFLEKIIKEQKVTVFGTGDNTRNYIYVNDVVRFLMLSIRNIHDSGIYNVSSDVTLTINELIGILRRVISDPFEAVYVPERKSDNNYIDLDNKAILSKFENFSFTPVESAIKETYTSIKNKLVKS
jgi:UDP-glucose 4-epimerase